MKTKFLTSNVNIAAAAAFGGLAAISYFAIFFEKYGIHLSIVAFAISLWGFLSLKQLDTEQDTPKPKKQRWRKVGIITALIVFIGGGLLFGAIKMIDATQAETPDCVERTRLDCIKDMPPPICPPQQQHVPCQLDAAGQGITKEIKEFTTCHF